MLCGTGEQITGETNVEHDAWVVQTHWDYMYHTYTSFYTEESDGNAGLTQWQYCEEPGTVTLRACTRTGDRYSAWSEPLVIDVYAIGLIDPFEIAGLPDAESVIPAGTEIRATYPETEHVEQVRLSLVKADTYEHIGWFYSAYNENVISIPGSYLREGEYFISVNVDA